MNKINMLLISILSICLACQDKEINLLNEQAKEHPFKGKVKSMAVSSGTNKTTTEWAYDATTPLVRICDAGLNE